MDRMRRTRRRDSYRCGRGAARSREGSRQTVPAMRAPVQMQNKSCSCGGGCPRCRDMFATWAGDSVRYRGEADGGAMGTSAVQAVRMPDSPALETERERTARSSRIVEEAKRGQQLDAPQQPGEVLPARLRVEMERRLGGDFSRVIIHRDERRNTQRLQAKAYTYGRHIVFHEGAYQPGSSEGRELLAHELAHAKLGAPAPDTTRPIRITQPGDIEERSAQAQLRGETAHSRGDRSHTIFRGPFDSEDPDHRARRLAVIRLARLAAERLRTALHQGYIWYFETVTRDGVDVAHGERETFAEREARLRELIGDLIGLARDLESAPIPTAWLDPIVRDSSGSLDIGSYDAQWQDTARFYAHRGVASGRTTDLLFINVSYIEKPPIRQRAVGRSPISRGVRMGIYIAVPDPENDPLTYTRVTGFERLPGRGVILDVWSDDFGYYYLYEGAKHYLPGRP